MKKIMFVLSLFLSFNLMAAGSGNKESILTLYTKHYEAFKLADMELEAVTHFVSTRAYILVKINGERYGTISPEGFYGNGSVEDLVAYVEDLKAESSGKIVMIATRDSKNWIDKDLKNITDLIFADQPL